MDGMGGWEHNRNQPKDTPSLTVCYFALMFFAYSSTYHAISPSFPAFIFTSCPLFCVVAKIVQAIARSFEMY